MFDNVEVDGVVYPTRLKKHSAQCAMYVEVQYPDSTWHSLTARYTAELALDLKSICGLDAEKELQKILIEETKLEISRKNDGQYWNEMKEKYSK